MAGRIRSVKPEWLEDERVASLSSDARVLSIALLLLADDHGRGRGHPNYIAAHVFANSQESLATASRAIRELVASGFVDLYTVRGQSYFAIRNWTKHQRVDKPGAPRVPPPEEAETPRETTIRETLANVPVALANSQEILAPDLRSPISDLDPRGGGNSRPPPPPLKPDAQAVRAELAKADDLWPDDESVTSTARRIADNVSDPMNRAKGDHVPITREAVAYARTEKGKFEHATAATLLGKAEQKVGWVLADYRTGKRRKDGTGPGIAPTDLDHVPIADEIRAARDSIPTRIDPEPPPLTDEERKRRAAQLAEMTKRLGNGGRAA